MAANQVIILRDPNLDSLSDGTVPHQSVVEQLGAAAAFLKRSGLVEESLAGKTYTCGITAPAHGKWELFPVLSRLKVQAKILSYLPPLPL